MRKNWLLRIVVMMCLWGVPLVGVAQNVNVEDLVNLKKKQKVKLSGGVSANATSFTANEMSGRQPFTYQLNGNMNLSLFELLNIPLSFSLNNYGQQFTYPTLPNRFSLHPSYKWARCHIGDVSMSFSPYTLNGHQFTGAGVELSPGRWAFAAMGGRLLRKVEYNPAVPGLLPAYERFGYGVKARYNGSDFFLGGTFFTAKDRVKEGSFQSDSLGILPKSNVAVSVEGGISLIQNLKLSAEYAVSLLTRDTRSQRKGNSMMDRLIKRRESTSYYYAVKAALDYTFMKNTIGVGYERISPQYETLGAYYFNNDYENVTLNYARSLFEGKVNIAVNGGFQHDNLDDSKQEKNTRIIAAANVTCTPNENLNVSFSASTFQGHRNIKSQFDYINQTTPYENLDTLNFTQISQNIDMNMNWTIQRNEKRNQNLMVYLSYQEAADKQGRYILPGNLTRFVNASTTYGVEWTPLHLNLNAGVNVSNNYSNLTNFLTLGPVVSASIGLLERTLVTGLTFFYNRSMEKGVPMADVFNCRWNANYRFLKRHGLQADLFFQQRNLSGQASGSGNLHSLTSTFGYFYSF